MSLRPCFPPRFQSQIFHTLLARKYTMATHINNQQSYQWLPYSMLFYLKGPLLKTHDNVSHSNRPSFPCFWPFHPDCAICLPLINSSESATTTQDRSRVETKKNIKRQLPFLIMPVSHANYIHLKRSTDRTQQSYAKRSETLDLCPSLGTTPLIPCPGPLPRSRFVVVIIIVFWNLLQFH